ncbi:MAG: hypothetical protein JNK21_10560 [Rhodospirillaceae bacterium]|nr:hypothetical protein [Rhodospirillaceae bacterium]
MALSGIGAPAYGQQPAPKSEASKPASAKPDAAKASKAPKTDTAKPADAKPTDKKPDVAKPGAADAPEAAAPESALPLPRFVSFRTEPVNARTGPGVRYPVDWVYMRRRLPVEIVAEFETWRQIRDSEGAESWVHQSMVSGRRTGMVKGQAQPLRKTNTDAAETLAMLEPGVLVDVVRCPDGVFCRVEVSGLQGWLKRDQFWGVYAQEIIE